MSTMSRCEQTWIDGRRMFDLQTNSELRKRDQAWRRELVQLILDGGPKKNTKVPNEEKKVEKVNLKVRIAEEDRWLRYDEYCNSRGTQQKAASRQFNRLRTFGGAE